MAYLPARLPTAFSIVRRDIAEARDRQEVAEREAARLRLAIETALELLRLEPRDGFRVRMERAARGLRLALT